MRYEARKPGRPETYFYPDLEPGEYVEMSIYCVSGGRPGTTLQKARTAFLNAAKRKGHVIETQVYNRFNENKVKVECLLVHRIS